MHVTPCAAQPRDQRVEPLGLVLRQAARRLVEDDDARAAADRRGDLHASAAGRWSARRRAGRTSMSAPIAASISRALARASRARETKRPRARQRPEAEVLGDRQVLAERQLLVDHADAGGERLARARRSATGRPTITMLPRVGRVDAGEDLPERALAGAVLAAQRVARPRGDLEADVLERDDARESAW